MLKKIPISSFYALTLLFIPFLGMQFSEEINWSIFDFLLMGVLLFVLSLGIHFILKKTLVLNLRILFISFAIVLFLFIWAELAVGIIDSRFAGN